MTKGLILPVILPHDLGRYALLREAHTLVAMLFFALILAHLATALMHGSIRRDGVLRSVTVGHTAAPLPDAAQGQPPGATAGR